MGKVFLVGAGPGDPNLITVKGRQCLRRAQLVLYDDLSNSALLEEVPEGVEMIYVGKRQGHKAMEQDEVCRRLVEGAGQGKRVVRLKGGDPFVFGRGGEEAEALALARIPYEVVPGVSAAVAVPAYAGIPLTHRDHADGFQVFTGHGPALAAPPTAVVLMGMRRLQENADRLSRRGYAPDTPAAVIEQGTRSGQRTAVATLSTIAAAAAAAGLAPPGILVVGEVVSLRERLRWFEDRPLFGKKVLVTRARHQAAETCRMMEALGAEAVTLPTIAIRPLDPAPLRRAVRALTDYDFLVVTSANTLAPLRDALGREGLDSRALSGVIICAIGPGTSRALAELGLTADRVPGDYRAEGLLELLPRAAVEGRRILLPRAAVARDVLPRTLRERGGVVDLIRVYETVLPGAEQVAPGLRRLEAGVDAITFTSASTVVNFAAIVGDRLEELVAGSVIAAIGPITRDACNEVGLDVDVMPDTYTLAAMTDALAAHLGRTQDQRR